MDICSKCPTPINTFRLVSFQVQLSLERQVHHANHSQYQSGYNSVCILRYLSYKIQLNQELKVHTNTIININQDTTQSYWLQLNIILNKYPPFNRVIQDTSCSITKKNFSHTVITVLFQLAFILISMLQVKLMDVITSFSKLYTSVVKLITILIWRS